MKYLSLMLLLLFFFESCNQKSEPSTAEEIIERAIETAGGEIYEKAEINFTFRENKYSSRREGRVYEFTRSITDSLGEAKDVLRNDGFRRLREGREEELHDTLKTAFANSVNSVHYFVQLPYGLNAPAVEAELVGQDSIAGETYYEIKVGFKEEGGGTDHEDEYMYWIHKEDYTVDYLAYRFYVNKGGIRFRKAYDPRRIGGIRFVDYENYKLGEGWQTFKLSNLDERFERDELVPVSIIETEIEEVTIHE